MTTLSEALIAYKVCAKAEGKSRRTIEWVTSSVRCFADFLGDSADITTITANDFRRFINVLRDTRKYSQHPYHCPRKQKLSESSINTYARAVRAFFGHLEREELINTNLLARVRLPKVPNKVVPTFSEDEIVRLLSMPDKRTDRGFRDYTIMIVLIDTAIRVSELAGLRVNDIDWDQGYLRVMGKGSRERYVPMGSKVSRAMLKYKLKHRPEPLATDRYWLTVEGKPLEIGRIEKIIGEYGKQAGLDRCYPHKLRHTSSVLYLRNGGDPFTLQRKLGHSSLQMTRHYSNLADSDVRAAHLKHSPADRLRI